jgi:hypothetical protein
MIHSVQFREGRASYLNRYVRTAGWQKENRAGRAVFTGMLESAVLPRAVQSGTPYKKAANTPRLAMDRWLWREPAPFFRILDPVTQGEKFDPIGDYVRCWIRVLQDLPNEWIHKPWAPHAHVLDGARIKLGSTYPRPIVHHRAALSRALQALQRVKN